MKATASSRRSGRVEPSDQRIRRLAAHAQAIATATIQHSDGAGAGLRFATDPIASVSAWPTR